MPLIEEKTGFGSFRLSGQTLRTLRKRCARCENFSRHGRNETATLAMLLTIPAPNIATVPSVFKYHSQWEGLGEAMISY